MKIKILAFSILLLITGVSCSKKNQLDNDMSASKALNNQSNIAAQPDAPLTWKEHWFEHNQLLNRVYSDTSIAVYYDDAVDRRITWPNTYLAQV